VDTLRKLKESLAAREAEKIRHREYKEKKKALGPRPTKLEVCVLVRVVFGTAEALPWHPCSPLVHFVRGP
jgi:hypothetical protein